MRSAAQFLALILAVGAPAAAQFVLTTTDGKSTRGAPAGLDAAGRLLWKSGDKIEAVAKDSVVGFESDASETSPDPGGVRLDLVGGDSLFGRLEDAAADEVKLVVKGLGSPSFKLDDVAVLWNRDGRNATDIHLPPSEDDDDRLFVEREGGLDWLPGTLDRITPGEVVFSSSAAGDRRAFSFSKDRVVAVRLATGEKSKDAPRTCLVRLRDGSRASGELKAGPDGGFVLKFAHGPEAPLDPAFIRSVAFVGGSFAYLSDLEPTRFVSTPFLNGGLVHGLVKDRGAKLGDPLRIGEERFSKGVLLFARSEAAYRLDGHGRLTAKVGLDPATSARELQGSARLKISADGVVIWESPLLTAGAAAIPLELDLKGAKELTIVAAFGDSFDAGARVVLGNAMLLKRAAPN